MKLRIYLHRFLGLFPQAVPVGVTAFDAYIDSLSATYDLPTKDRETIKFAVAARILGFGPLQSSAAPYSFVRALRAGAAKQIAGNAFQQVKEAQKARQLAEEQAAKAAATAVPTVADDQTQ